MTMMSVWLVAANLVVLHSAGGGYEIIVNPVEVTILRGPTEGRQNLPKDAQCMVNFSDGKFVSVIEDCEMVRKLFEEATK
jgi:hypothetical protein